MILNFGSLNVDILMQVDKLPTPGDTILCPGYEALPGGKGANQAKAAALAGSQVKMYGQVGEDGFGKIAQDSLRAGGVDISGVLVNASPTGCAMISVDARGENIITVGSGANQAVSSSIVPEEELSEAATLVLQMEVNPKENWSLLKRAKKKGCRTILNLAPAKKIPAEALTHLDYLVLNEVEAHLLGKQLKVPTSSLLKFAEFLAKKFDLTSIITRGDKGAFAYSHKGEYWDVTAMKLDAVDTTGAGDAFVGIFSALLDQGENPADGLALRHCGKRLVLPEEGGSTQHS